MGQQLVAQVNAQGGGTLSGQNVNWSVNPASAGTLTSVTGTSDVNGRVSNNLTLSGSAAGTVTVTVSLASNASFRASFTITAIPLITAGTITKAGGDGQFAIVSQQFTNPLVVQVTTNTGALAAGIPVSFGASGGAILSATSVSTGSAQVTVTAPAIAGAITVTASVSGLPAVTFNLTASPPGPTFTANSFVNAADQKVGSISACGLATIIASGIAPGVQGTVSANAFGFGGLPTSLAGDTVTFGGALAPIVSVANISGSQQLTFQVPCNATTGSNSVSVSVGGGSAATTVSVLPYSPGVFQTTTIIALSSGGNYPMGIFVRPDGSFVSQTNAARKGEVITAFVTGLGAATPSVGNNALPLPTAISTANANPVVGVANQGVPVISAQLSPNLVGVYQVSFQIPSSIPSGTQVFSVGVPSGGQTYYSLGSAIPIQ
ncbi:Ig domain protein, group 1 domain protein (fragment) [Candidatus Sulfopaludibacter sp. SbA3]